MKIYLSIDDQKEGPFTLFQVEERLRGGDDLSETTLGWYDGMEKWAPLRDLPPFESLFRLRDADLEKERKRQYAERLATDDMSTEPDHSPLSALKCFARFAARWLDFLLFFNLCIAVMFAFRSAGWIELSYFQFFSKVLILLLPPWHLFEAYMITRWGTTPGKALLGIRITDKNGDHLGYAASLRRSLGVFVVGLACYIWFLPIISSLFAFYYLWWHGRTFWDSTTNTKVTHKAFHLRQVFLPFILLFVITNLLQEPIKEFNAEIMKEWEAMKKQVEQGTD